MPDQLWPAEAREAVAEIIVQATGTLDHSYDTADAVLAALADHAVPRVAYDQVHLDRGVVEAMYYSERDDHERFRQAVLDLAQQWDQEADDAETGHGGRSLWSDELEQRANRLRALAGGGQ